MTRIILVVCALLLSNGFAFGQLLCPEEIPPIPLLPQPLVSNHSIFPKNLSSLKRKLKNTEIENPAIRYAIQYLENKKYADQELNQALNTLIQYAENDSLKRMVNYLRDYIKTTGEKEEALNKIQTKLLFDSVALYTRHAHLLTTDYQIYMNSDLSALANYVRTDSNYRWLKDISRDSVLLEVLNVADSSVQFWINNGRAEFHRFWALNKTGDSIGTWIEVAPPGNNIRVYVDDNVYPAKIDAQQNNPRSLANQLGDKYFDIQQIKAGNLYRRHWTYYSEVELAMGQGYLANWSSGGENSLSVLSNIRFFINYNKNKTSWENFMHYRLGFLKSGDQGLRKNEEKLELNSKLGHQAFKNWYYTTQLNIQTMIFNSYEYSENEKKIVGNFMTPAYFTLSLGLDYKPNENFSLYLSPIAGKWTFVRDTVGIDPTRYGVEVGKKSKGDAGARLELRNKFSLFKIMDVRNELIMFSSYYNSQQTFTANWQVQIDFKINYFMRASIYTNVVYDENYSKKMQFKENLNLGVNFRF